MEKDDFGFVRPVRARQEFGLLERGRAFIKAGIRLRNPLVEIAAQGLEEHRLPPPLQDAYALRVMGRRNVYWCYGRLLSGNVTSDIARAALVLSMGSGIIGEALSSEPASGRDLSLMRQLSGMARTLSLMGIGEDFGPTERMLRGMASMECQTMGIGWPGREAVYASELQGLSIRRGILLRLHSDPGSLISFSW